MNIVIASIVSIFRTIVGHLYSLHCTTRKSWHPPGIYIACFQAGPFSVKLNFDIKISSCINSSSDPIFN